MKNLNAQLKSELLERIKLDFDRRTNIIPKYSLRVHAKFLGVSPATLSLYLAGKIDMSPRAYRTIAPKLDFSPDEFRNFESMVKNEKISKVKNKFEKVSHTSLQMDEFNFISEWYYYAILEVFTLDSYKEDPKWIADKLGMTDSNKVKDALDHLINLKLLVRNEYGKLENSSRFTSILDYNFSSTGMRQRQKRILDLSKEKIDTVDISKRDHSGLTLAMDSRLIPEVKEKIKRMRRSLGNFISKNSESRDSIYEVHISFIPLTDTK